MMPVHQVLTYVFSCFCYVIWNEVMNLMRPEDQKMKQIDIMYAGLTMFMVTISYVVPFIWLPFGLLFVVAVCVYHWFGIYRRRRRSRLLPSPIENVA